VIIEDEFYILRTRSSLEELIVRGNNSSDSFYIDVKSLANDSIKVRVKNKQGKTIFFGFADEADVVQGILKISSGVKFFKHNFDKASYIIEVYPIDAVGRSLFKLT